jgi:hypothetical protein
MPRAPAIAELKPVSTMGADKKEMAELLPEEKAAMEQFATIQPEASLNKASAPYMREKGHPAANATALG